MEIGSHKATSIPTNEPRSEKTSLRGFRPGPTQTRLLPTEDGWRLEILDLGSREIVLSGHREADLRLCFRICKNPVFEIGSLKATPIPTNEPRCEKTGLRGFRSGPTQTRLSHTEDGWRVEILDLGNRGIVLSV